MKYIDYCEKLKIGFSDQTKFVMLRNNIRMFWKRIQFTHEFLYLQSAISYTYFSTIGEYVSSCDLEAVQESIGNAGSISDLVSKYVTFVNIIRSALEHFPVEDDEWLMYMKMKDFICKRLIELNISFSIENENDNIFILPKGASEFDEALVSAPLEWLEDYPKTHKTFCIALEQYAEKKYVRDVADNLRKALEVFLQEFLKNEKNLENNKKCIGQYFDTLKIDSAFTALFTQIMATYQDINNRTAKHHDKVEPALLEFLLYQTGILIRMAIVAKRELENPNNAD